MKCAFLLAVMFFTTEVFCQSKADIDFEKYELTFLERWWKNNPGGAIGAGYGRYYEVLEIPGEATLQRKRAEAKAVLRELKQFAPNKLSPENKISWLVLSNHMQRSIWYIDTFRMQHSDASSYNLGGSVYSILTQQYAPLDRRLLTIAERLTNSGKYYQEALLMITNPTREHTNLGILQNKGSKSVFTGALADSIAKSGLTDAQKSLLKQRSDETLRAIDTYIAGLNAILSNPNQQFRDFRIGKELYARKFYYDMVSDLSPEQTFDRAVTAKQSYHRQMTRIGRGIWPKYFPNESVPADSLKMVAKLIDRISDVHTQPKDLLDTINAQLGRMKAFIIKKDLFDFDTTAPIIVRYTPAFAAGVAMASANFPMPYQKVSNAYYNIANLTAAPAAQAESQLREHNHYLLQVLNIHEAVPGHCMQGIYNAKRSPDMIKSVFSNSPMTEGWAVYSERMMLENGWGNNEPELWLMYYKWSLRIAVNTILDYGLHNLNYSKEKITGMLRDEAFQELSQVEEKYNRATLSQVQLCSYFTGAESVKSLKEAWMKKNSGKSLKDFHEGFLSYGSSPVKYIGEVMMSKN